MTTTIGHPENFYDADAQVRALQVPKIKIGGLVYEGRVLSAEQVAPYFARMDSLILLHEKIASEEGPDEADEQYMTRIAGQLEAIDNALRPLLRMVFPKNYIVFWRPDPVDRIIALPLTVRTDWLRDFFVCVRSWLPTSSSPRTRSSDSGDST